MLQKQLYMHRTNTALNTTGPNMYSGKQAS